MSEHHGDLEILGTLGKGGFGTVYLAKLNLGGNAQRRVAVKVLKEGLEEFPDLLARQRDEARLLAKLDHEAIVRVYRHTEVGGRPAVVMDYVEGVDVSDLLRATPGRQLPAPVALTIAEVAADALDAAWNTPNPDDGQPLHVVHRDIKPANLLVTVNGAVKVLDFGIARAEFDREGLTGSVAFGTPRFMAPEQWLGGDCSAPLDVYALGVTLFEMLTGTLWARPPVARDTFEQHVTQTLDGAALDPETRALLDGMTAWDPAERFSAADVARCAGELARNVPGEALRTWARRVVPPLVRARAEAESGTPLPITGSTATTLARETDLVAAPEPPPANPWGLRAAGALAALAVLVAVVVVAGVSAHLVLQAERQPDAPVVSAPAPAPVPVPVPALAEPVPAPATVEATPPPVAAPRTTRAAAAPAPAVVPVAATAEAAPQTFDLRVSTNPIGAEVWIDGEPAGETPQAHRKVPAGRHVVRVQLEGATDEKSFDIGPDTPHGVRYTFASQKWETRR